MKGAKTILINQCIVEFTDVKDIEIIYIPDQTQLLKEGRPYRFVFKGDKIQFREQQK